MSWIAEYDTQGREFPTCVHVTKTTGTMTHGATYVPIEDGKAVRAENAKLREERREYQATIDSLVDECTDHEAENAKLREELADAPKCEACEAMLDCDECLRADGSHKERRRLSIENAKLRELCRRFSEYVSYDRCEGCVTKRRCNNGEVDERWQMGEIRKLARELGIEAV